jgi:hypothetical protein
MAKSATSERVENNVLLVSDNLNYLCVKAKDIMENNQVENMEVVYDSVLNTKEKVTNVSFDGIDDTVLKLRDLLGTSTYRTVTIKDIKQNHNRRGRKLMKPAVITEIKVSDIYGEEAHSGRRGAPSLSQDVLDFRYDVISDYDAGKITSDEAIAKMNVTEGAFRNIVSDYHRCKKLNRRRAFGKSGIINRTYKLYESNKISSAMAADNIGVSVATFLNWYKHDTGNKEIGRGRKRVKR